MLRKLILAAFLTINLLAVMPVGAQTDVVPEFNPICWKKKDCIKVRSQYGGKAFENGFVSEDPCTGGEGDDAWGKCLPAGTARTQIKFGGISEFSGIGDFILKNYQFAITVAAILGVIVIIMSGFQWTMSAGNSEMISAAKHRIGNAIIGLFIAYGSYFILNTINPDLVNLRPPSTFMVRPFNEIPKFCYMVPVKVEGGQTQVQAKSSNKIFALAANGSEQSKKISSTSSNPSPNLTFNDVVEATEDNCGARFFFEGGGNGTCFGAKCQGGKTCTNMHFTNQTLTDYSCEPGILFGMITANYVVPPICGVVAGYVYPFIESLETESKIYKVCKDDTLLPSLIMVSNAMIAYPTSEEKNLVGFVINSLSDTSQSCPEGPNGTKEFYGYALGLNLTRNCLGNYGSDNVAIDKNGNHLGKLNHGNGPNYYISGVTRQISKTDFWTYDELQKGQQIYIDVSTFKPQENK